MDAFFTVAVSALVNMGVVSTAAFIYLARPQRRVPVTVLVLLAVGLQLGLAYPAVLLSRQMYLLHAPGDDWDDIVMSATGACHLMVLPVMALFAWFVGSEFERIRVAKNRELGQCKNCGYSLVGLPHQRCPECEHPNS